MSSWGVFNQNIGVEGDHLATTSLQV